ncbi:MAG: hypothetical protein VB099_00045 [Candidatus Limiplasma sp.]|nr:hypothetical protein [Candidatus Limiplasma sp.]
MSSNRAKHRATAFFVMVDFLLYFSLMNQRRIPLVSVCGFWGGVSTVLLSTSLGILLSGEHFFALMRICGMINGKTYRFLNFPAFSGGIPRIFHRYIALAGRRVLPTGAMERKERSEGHEQHTL